MPKVLSNEKSHELLESEGHQDPTHGTWGIATRDFSTGGFWWFKNQNALMDFISRALPSIETDPEDIEDFDNHVKVYQNLIEVFKNDETEFLPIVRHHNQFFSGGIELVWVGSFAELTNGHSPFSRFLRAEFHESEDAIAEDEADDFGVFVGEDVSYLSMFDIA